MVGSLPEGFGVPTVEDAVGGKGGGESLLSYSEGDETGIK